MSPEYTPTEPLDIEFPLQTRAGDATLAGTFAASNSAIGPSTILASPSCSPLPFLAERLLAAAGPFGLDVEIKSEERVVGTWTLEVNPRDANGAFVSQAKADLYVCASVHGDLRATAAFLVLRQWWVSMTDLQQLEQLYGCLGVAALERLDSLLGGAPNEGAEARVCVLFLVDGRRQDRRFFSLDRLQIRLLEELESEHAIAGMDLRVAHGRGIGTRPQAICASTLPTALKAGSDEAARPPGRRPMIGEVFVRETVSTANVRWNRRASDRVRAIAESAETAPADAQLLAVAGTIADARVPSRELSSSH
ncbi:MAG: hypothetical protein ABI699_06440 [Caldimonas sp.]